MPDVFLRPGEANPNDVRLCDPASPCGAGSITVHLTGNLLTALLGSVSVRGDANVSLTGLQANLSLGKLSVNAPHYIPEYRRRRR